MNIQKGKNLYGGGTKSTSLISSSILRMPSFLLLILCGVIDSCKKMQLIQSNCHSTVFPLLKILRSFYGEAWVRIPWKRAKRRTSESIRSEERRVGKECRSWGW